jgi:hypothetical protein
MKLTIKVNKYLDEITICDFHCDNSSEEATLFFSKVQDRWTLRFANASYQDSISATKLHLFNTIAIEMLEKLESGEYERTEESLNTLVERFKNRYIQYL